MIIKNTVYNLLGHVLPLGAAVICIPLIIDGLGIERFGILILVWLIVGYFGIFDLGMRSPSISWDIVKRIDYPDVSFQNNSIAVYRIQRSLGQRVNEREIFKASDGRGSVIP